jgi:hypothetical protein
MAIKSKKSIFSEKSYQERLVLAIQKGWFWFWFWFWLVLVLVGFGFGFGFFRPVSTSLSPKRPFQAQKIPKYIYLLPKKKVIIIVIDKKMFVIPKTLSILCLKITQNSHITAIILPQHKRP